MVRMERGWCRAGERVFSTGQDKRLHERHEEEAMKPEDLKRRGSSPFTFRLLLDQKAGHALLLPQHEGHVPTLVCGDHLQSQAVDLALAAHLIQVVVLEQVVPQPPLCSGHPHMGQLHFEHGVLSGGHCDVVEHAGDPDALWEWGGGAKRV